MQVGNFLSFVDSYQESDDKQPGGNFRWVIDDVDLMGCGEYIYTEVLLLGYHKQ